MSSWDSIYELDKKLKVKGTNATLPLSARIVYDTPNFVSYSIVVATIDFPKAGLELEGDDSADMFITLKSWDREASTVDAREMGDEDVYDLFAGNIEKYLVKLGREGLSLRQLRNLLNGSY